MRVPAGPNERRAKNSIARAHRVGEKMCEDAPAPVGWIMDHDPVIMVRVVRYHAAASKIVLWIHVHFSFPPERPSSLSFRSVRMHFVCQRRATRVGLYSLTLKQMRITCKYLDQVLYERYAKFHVPSEYETWFLHPGQERG